MVACPSCLTNNKFGEIIQAHPWTMAFSLVMETWIPMILVQLVGEL